MSYSQNEKSESLILIMPRKTSSTFSYLVPNNLKLSSYKGKFKEKFKLRLCKGDVREKEKKRKKRRMLKRRKK